MMTDRHVVNSSLKNMLEKWRTDCLPLIIENFNTFSDDLKKSLIDINHFKCNLHVLVNLGSQAKIALKEWAKAIIITDTFDWGVASTPDFIRATTKLCAPGADQKSGYSLLFETYLKSCTPPVALQMSTFYGHRITFYSLWQQRSITIVITSKIFCLHILKTNQVINSWCAFLIM